ncbi:MAG: deoxyribose-phosphate aldolase [Aigarchaeota archaeon]|nr:deoxyribose-phosphate aldolase [Aigarchaeota archaeon]
MGGLDIAMPQLRPQDLAPKIQHTNLNPDATRRDIERLCEECVRYGFDAAVVNPIWVRDAKRLLRGTEVKVCAVVNIPLGGSTTLAKVVEVRNAVAMGCDEVDFMIAVGYLKSGMIEVFREDTEAMVEAAEGRVVKAILEFALLTEDELRTAARVCEESGVHYLKNSSGWGKGGHATVEVVRAMRSVAGPNMRIKASAGIRDYRTAAALVEAGADLLGTSAGVQIVTGAAAESGDQTY